MSVANPLQLGATVNGSTPRSDALAREHQRAKVSPDTPGVVQDWIWLAQKLEREVEEKRRENGALERALVSLIGLFDPYGRGRINESEDECADRLARASDLLNPPPVGSKSMVPGLSDRCTRALIDAIERRAAPKEFIHAPPCDCRGECLMRDRDASGITRSECQGLPCPPHPRNSER